MKVQIFPLGYCDPKDYTRVVCVCRYQGKYVFAYNTKRKGLEIPGGHIEANETWEEAIKRELYEETGALQVDITPVCVYKISTFGLLCFGEVTKMGTLPSGFEMAKIVLTDTLPDNLTYPDTYKLFLETVVKKLGL